LVGGKIQELGPRRGAELNPGDTGSQAGRAQPELGQRAGQGGYVGNDGGGGQELGHHVGLGLHLVVVGGGLQRHADELLVVEVHECPVHVPAAGPPLGGNLVGCGGHLPRCGDGGLAAVVLVDQVALGVDALPSVDAQGLERFVGDGVDDGAFGAGGLPQFIDPLAALGRGRIATVVGDQDVGQGGG